MPPSIYLDLPENHRVITTGYLNCNGVIILYHIINFNFFFRYSEGEIRFNLMAIVSDRKMVYEQKIAELQRQLAEVRGRVFMSKVLASSFSQGQYSFFPSFFFFVKCI